MLPYKINVKYRPGADNIADYLSRNPMSQTDLHILEDIVERYINFITDQAIPKAMNRAEAANYTQQD